MTSAKVTVPFNGVPNGEVHPRLFDVGEIVVGELADVAVREGWAVAVPEATAQPADLKPAAADGPKPAPRARKKRA